MTPSQEYININKRIQRIKDRGLTPVTLKSPSDITQKFMHEKGKGNEGLIMSYKEAALEANTRNEILTIEEYNKSIELFMNSYAKQTYVKGAYEEAYKTGVKILETYGKDHLSKSYKSDFENDWKSLSKKQLVTMLQDIGKYMNELGDAEQRNYKNGNSPTEFLTMFDQWIEENTGLRE